MVNIKMFKINWLNYSVIDLQRVDVACNLRVPD